MAGQSKSDGGRHEKRQSRLADKLRQNLVKRKAKARAVRAAVVSREELSERGTPPRDGTDESQS